HQRGRTARTADLFAMAMALDTVTGTGKGTPISLASFSEKKRKILEAISVPDDEYTDLSPKGSIDEGILALMHG
ncbi:hypothetical protein KEM52_004848, partial [Ascosphaera acerosa]